MKQHRNQEQFDLIQQLDKTKGRKDQRKGKGFGGDLNFDELEDQQKQLKLPVLATKNNNKNDKQSSKSSYQKIGLADITSKNVQNLTKDKFHKQDYFQQDLDQELVKQSPQSYTKKQQKFQKEEEQYKQPVREDVYENQDFEQQKYDQDFEEHEEKQNSAKPEKKNEESKKILAANSSKPQKQLNREVASLVKKKVSVDRIQSRNSDHSQNHSSLSRVKQENKKQQPPNKYTSIAQKTCLNYDRTSLQGCSLDKIVFENDKMRKLIKKFNDELNDMINRNIIYLKNKKDEKIVPAQDVLKLLEEHRNNNQVVLQNTLKDLERLRGKEGELRGEEFQLSLEQKIAQTKTSITQTTKLITRLNNEVNNEGNKLSKFDKENAYTSEINNMKNGLANAKKDQIANQQLSQKLDLKFQELSQKLADVDNRYIKIVEQCKMNGYSINNTAQISKKAEQIKKKLQIARIHKSKTQSLYKTKGQMSTHELEQLKLQLKNIQTQIQTCQISCSQIQIQSKKAVQKTKKGSKLSVDLINYLQGIIIQLQTLPSNRQLKDEHSSFSQPKNTKKYQSQKNVQKVNTQIKQQKTQDDINLKKPLLFKKKEKEQEKPQERIWVEDKLQQKKVEKTKQTDLNKFQDNDKKEEENKRPFVIFKKNKEVKPQTPEITDKAQKQIDKQIKKQTEIKEEEIKIAPRMKFKRNKPQQTTQSQKIVQVIAKNQEFPQYTHKNKTKTEQQQQKAIFAPKRFNIKLKDKKNDQTTAYVSSVAQTKKEDTIKQVQFRPKGLLTQKQQVGLDKINKVQLQNQKPRFNLNLKDKQKQITKSEEEYPKFTINLNDKIQVTVSKQNNNPYANQTSNQQVKKAREGPLKKSKPVPTIAKQQGSIYDHVEDLTNVPSLNPTQMKTTKNQSEQPDLNKLLGINKNNKPFDNDLIIDTKLLVKGKKQAKKDTNFFAQLEI